MRKIVLDTETTGLDPRQGHRIIEIACIELVSRRLTGHHLHRYINPEREIDAGAAAVHGITLEFLADKPKFADIAAEFIDFVRGAELVIHNAPFDIGFLNAELDRLGMVPIETVCHRVTDTLKMARERYPGKRNNLDALCERYQINNAHRTLHGALLDTELLAEVYLAMTRGQDSLIVESEVSVETQALAGLACAERKPLVVRRADAEELALHASVLEAIQKESQGNCLWLAETAAEAAVEAEAA